MSTVESKPTQSIWIPRQRPWPKRDGIFRFTVAQFYKLDELGYFEDRHVELIAGVIYEMTAGPSHSAIVEITGDALRPIFGAGWVVRVEKPLNTGRRSLPEPDLAIVEGSHRDFLERHPNRASLVVEVSETTLRKDRTLKAHIYAMAGVPEYWIINLIDRQLEVHRNPGADPSRKGRFHYAEVSVVKADGHASPLARPEARIAVADLLP